MACVDCHTDLSKVSEYPHAETLARVQCRTCHESADAAYTQGVHAAARRADASSPSAVCADCHGVHDIRASTDPDSRTHHLRVAATCRRCHGNQALGIPAGDVSRLFQDSIHGRALSRSGLVVAPNCASCHGGHDILRAANRDSPVFKQHVPATCGKCHEGVTREFQASIHGVKVAAGVIQAPACHDCHTAHDIQRTDRDSWKQAVNNECGTCHVESIASYRDTFHGKVTALGFTRVATCATCHTAHNIHKTSDSRSTVSPGRVVETCGKCHEGATASFAQYDPHPNVRNYARNPLLWWINRFYTVLITTCFAAFGLHTALWFHRSSRERAARPRPTETGT